MEVRNCINFLLGTAQNKVFKYFSKRLSEFGITPSQYGVLNCLWENGDLNPSQIREILFLEASSISGTLDRMQKNDLIERHIDPNNRRVIIVTPTEKANSIRNDVEIIVKEMNDKFFSPLTANEKSIFVNSLTQIIDLN